jgi:hypothetical protein
MRVRLALLITSLILLASATASAQRIRSLYTDLSPKKCKTLSSNTLGESSTQRCAGVAGYKLLVLEGDLRQSITVIKPDGSEHELNLWHSVGGGGFSHVGPRAEWRVKTVKGKLVPIALIVRFNVSENPEDATKTTSYLTVTKLTPQKICLIGLIPPTQGGNVEARAKADASADQPCLPPQ